MLHAVARMIISGKVNQKSVGVELWRPPHRRFGTHDLLNIAHECGPFIASVALARAVRPTVRNAPVFWRINDQPDRVRLVIHDIHEEVAAVEVRMARVELRKSAGEIVGEDSIADDYDAIAAPSDAPCLIVNSGDW